MGSAIGVLFGLLDHDPTGVLHHIQFGLAEMRVRFLTLGFSFFNLLLTLIEPVSCAVKRFSDDVEAIAAEPDTELTVGNHELLRGKQFGVEFLQSRCFFPLAADAIEQVCSLTHGYSPQAERRASSLMVDGVVRFAPSSALWTSLVMSPRSTKLLMPLLILESTEIFI